MPAATPESSMRQLRAGRGACVESAYALSGASRRGVRLHQLSQPECCRVISSYQFCEAVPWLALAVCPPRVFGQTGAVVCHWQPRQHVVWSRTT